MAGDIEDRFWGPEDLEILVQWIEEPGNQARFKKFIYFIYISFLIRSVLPKGIYRPPRFKKGPGLTKEAALAPLVDQLASRSLQ